ncbi:D-Ala-D-Ala carboxypeptidase family metallohydrolase [Microbulbifer sp. CAU 1566]|uniref:D-Ala-D-Ala carboxypeptidase family metallohydrolase n=1 Tax=unclassified Microbulbifer TaxID=2619833 RepID=UPI00135A20B3|nr:MULTISPECIES: D-Ala-D-Ala carboxypeptidase family metallohydrolase [unclassified Microbulbifer]MCK7597852.1 D-Ala-D-Ala carboxypeptidase family metallohydrolase [Microbulbifer sp. CAU 1566]
MDIKETPDHEFIDIHIERRRVIWIVALVLISLLALVVLTVEKTRELAERVVSPVEFIPEPPPLPKAPDLPLIFKIKGYSAASSSAFDKFLDSGNNREQFDELKQFLEVNNVGDVVPIFELMRQGTDWQEIGEQPFAIPPRKDWKTMVATLRVIRDHIIPELGQVTVLSGWRTPGYNAKAGGARSSKHLHFCGVDLIPEADFTRGELLPKLRKIHQRYGRKRNIGLGIYSGVRFHIDTCGFRRW